MITVTDTDTIGGLHMIKKIVFGLVLACLIGLTVFSPKQATAATSTANNRIGTPADDRTLYEDFTVGGIWYIKVKRPNNGSNGEVYAAGISIDMEKVVVPAVVTYNGKKYNVLGINDYGFAYETAIKSVVVENGVKYIGVEAFWDCSGLEKVSIGDSVNEIGRGCFSRCPALKQANIPDSLKIIPYGMFADCTSLKEITLGKNTTIIDESAFAYCTSLKKVKCKGLRFLKSEVYGVIAASDPEPTAAVKKNEWTVEKMEPKIMIVSGSPAVKPEPSLESDKLKISFSTGDEVTVIGHVSKFNGTACDYYLIQGDTEMYVQGFFLKEINP